MMPLSPALARRIDRLSRRAHQRYRYAHHPLCGAYAGEVFDLGRWRVCRGCVLAGAGAVFGVLVTFVPWLAPLALLATVQKKFLKRFLPSAVFCALLVNVFFRPSFFALVAAIAASALGVFWFVAYRRRGPNRSACFQCPHRNDACCPGVAPIVRRERAFRRVSSRWIEADVCSYGASV